MSLEELYVTIYAFLGFVDGFGVLSPKLLVLCTLGFLVFGIHIYDAEDMAVPHRYTFFNLNLKFLDAGMFGVIRFDGYILEYIA
jgi:hypothetical protein